MKYENYIFDLYGTLVDIHTEEEQKEVWEKLALFYGYYRAHYNAEELKEKFLKLVSGGEAQMKMQMSDSHEAFPELKIEEVFRKLYEEKGAAADETLSVHTGQFFRILTTEYVKVYEGAAELLFALKTAGKNVYLLSNAQRIFTEYELNVMNIAQYFDDIFISSDFGVRKPDERFFHRLLSRHQLDPERSIMIGNDLENDIGGAKRVGLSTLYIHSNISPELKREPDADYNFMSMDLQKVKRLLLELD